MSSDSSDQTQRQSGKQPRHRGVGRAAIRSLQSRSTQPSVKRRLNFDPISAILVTVFAYLSPQLFIGLVLGAFIVVTGANADTVFDNISDSTVGQFVTTALAYGSMLVVVALYMRWRRIRWADIGLGRGMRANDVLYALLIFAGYFVLSAFIVAAAGQLIPGIDVDQEQQIGFESAQGPGALLLVFVCLVVLPPLVEEIMIRGFLYSGLKTKLRPILAALIASFLFGIAHLQLGSGAPPLYVAAIDTFVLSMVLIWLRERTGSLWAGILVHALKNGIAFIVLFIVGTR